MCPTTCRCTDAPLCVVYMFDNIDIILILYIRCRYPEHEKKNGKTIAFVRDMASSCEERTSDLTVYANFCCAAPLFREEQPFALPSSHVMD